MSGLELKNYKVSQFAKAYNVCRTKVYQEMNAGRLKYFKVGRSTLIPKSAAEEWQKLMMISPNNKISKSNNMNPSKGRKKKC